MCLTLFSHMYLTSFQIYIWHPFKYITSTPLSNIAFFEKIFGIQLISWLKISSSLPVNCPFVSFFLPEYSEAPSPQLTTKQSSKSRLTRRESLSLTQGNRRDLIREKKIFSPLLLASALLRMCTPALHLLNVHPPCKGQRVDAVFGAFQHNRWYLRKARTEPPWAYPEHWC